MRKGWFKIHRALFEKAWFQQMGVRRIVVFELLNRAAYEETKLLDGTVLKPGQLVAGIRELARATALGERQVRTAIRDLKTVEFSTHQTTHLGTLITIVNWDTYQGNNEEGDTPNDTQATHPRHTGDTAATPKKNIRNKEVKNTISFADGSLAGITPADIEKWTEAYPNIDIRMQIKRAEVWLRANPNRHKKNYARFLTNWFSNAKPAPRSMFEPEIDDYEIVRVPND